VICLRPMAPLLLALLGLLQGSLYAGGLRPSLSAVHSPEVVSSWPLDLISFIVGAPELASPDRQLEGRLEALNAKPWIAEGAAVRFNPDSPPGDCPWMGFVSSPAWDSVEIQAYRLRSQEGSWLVLGGRFFSSYQGSPRSLYSPAAGEMDSLALLGSLVRDRPIRLPVRKLQIGELAVLVPTRPGALLPDPDDVCKKFEHRQQGTQGDGSWLRGEADMGSALRPEFEPYGELLSSQELDTDLKRGLHAWLVQAGQRLDSRVISESPTAGTP